MNIQRAIMRFNILLILGLMVGVQPFGYTQAVSPKKYSNRKIVASVCLGLATLGGGVAWWQLWKIPHDRIRNEKMQKVHDEEIMNMVNRVDQSLEEYFTCNTIMNYKIDNFTGKSPKKSIWRNCDSNVTHCCHRVVMRFSKENRYVDFTILYRKSALSSRNQVKDSMEKYAQQNAYDLRVTYADIDINGKPTALTETEFYASP